MGRKIRSCPWHNQVCCKSLGWSGEEARKHPLSFVGPVMKWIQIHKNKGFYFTLHKNKWFYFTLYQKFRWLLLAFGELQLLACRLEKVFLFHSNWKCRARSRTHKAAARSLRQPFLSKASQLSASVALHIWGPSTFSFSFSTTPSSQSFPRI